MLQRLLEYMEGRLMLNTRLTEIEKNTGQIFKKHQNETNKVTNFNNLSNL